MKIAEKNSTGTIPNPAYPAYPIYARPSSTMSSEGDNSESTAMTLSGRKLRIITNAKEISEVNAPRRATTVEKRFENLSDANTVIAMQQMTGSMEATFPSAIEKEKYMQLNAKEAINDFALNLSS